MAIYRLQASGLLAGSDIMKLRVSVDITCFCQFGQEASIQGNCCSKAVMAFGQRLILDVLREIDLYKEDYTSSGLICSKNFPFPLPPSPASRRSLILKQFQ